MRISLIVILFCLLSCGQQGQKQSKESAAKREPAQPVEQRRIILFFGNSITAGYNLDTEEAFPALLQQKLDSLGYAYKAVNAGLSGETSAGGLNRIDWVLQNTVPDIFFLELGANDGLRGLQLSETRKNLGQIIEKVKEVNPEVKVVVAGMQVPPNLGKAYTSEFRELFPQLAETTGAVLLPFLLEGVAGDPGLNLPDGIHPTAEGHQILAENVWEVLRPLLEKPVAL